MWSLIAEMGGAISFVFSIFSFVVIVWRKGTGVGGKEKGAVMNDES